MLCLDLSGPVVEQNITHLKDTVTHPYQKISFPIPLGSAVPVLRGYIYIYYDYSCRMATRGPISHVFS